MAVMLSQEELRRYGRHIVMPEVGEEGQQKLKTARVLVVGAGGLGSPALLYLSAAGVGTLGIVDFDVVDVTNLQRQILHSTDSIGQSKIESARERIRQINPNVQVETFPFRLTPENALEILRTYDVVIDGTDNFPTRYLVNDACVMLKKPNVYGSIFRFDGQVSVFHAEKGPCYRCLYPSPPPPELVPNCAEGGVLGALPGVIGTLQALEAMKLILGCGVPLIGRLLLFDGLQMQFQELHIKKNSDCPVCSEHPTIRKLIDYEEFCSPSSNNIKHKNEMSPKELNELMKKENNVFLLDVREQYEYRICNIGGVLIPLSTLAQHLDSLPNDKTIVVMCHHGIRSARAVEFLKGSGFKNVINLEGGIDEWSRTVDALVPRY
ncbi:MAG: molybdopterin-synthase adenylyltransferase MoeB [Ignavibacteriae bacterium]|nr:molybdopterin-synthase adenylyltransferase MoeB [Ignavibacteriota bacterium]